MSVRTTISLPDDLKARMDAVQEPVNWSAEAAKCFERLLGEIASRKKEKDMSDVIARLRASKRDAEDDHYRLGYDAGKRWAEHHATYTQLERAANFDVETFGGEWLAPWSGAHWVAFEILRADIGNESNEDLERLALDLWSNALLEDDEDWIWKTLDEGGDTILTGFIEGAGAVFAAVAHEI